MLTSTENQWIIFKVQSNVCGVSAAFVKEMIALPAVRPVPEAVSFIRGVINLRGTVYKVLDMRLLMGMKSFKEEYDALANNLHQRKQDHINWLTELENSVKENRDFKLTTDHHACAFGKWYDNYKADNFEVNEMLKEFDAPHQRIHKIGITATNYVKVGQQDKALDLIAHTKNTDLHLMIGMFDELTRKLALIQREIGIVIESDNKSAIITADAILSVENFTDEVIDHVRSVGIEETPDFIRSFAKYNEKGALALLIDAEKVLAET